MIKTKTAFIIPTGTIVSKKMMEWIKNNCKTYPKYDLPEGYEDLFGGFK